MDGIIAAVTDADIETTADAGYQGAGGTIRTPIRRPKRKGHNGWEKLATPPWPVCGDPSSAASPN